ncbi:hypothetical protein BDZ94DRAFT_1242306, partial [Collybia nuda]
MATEGNRYPPVEYGRLSGERGELGESTPEELCVPLRTNDGPDLVSIPDIRKLDILQRRWIVSRKRTINLFDMASLWKKIVVEKIDKETAQIAVPAPELRTVSKGTHPLYPGKKPYNPEVE